MSILEQKPRVGDENTVFEVTVTESNGVGVNLSSATVKQIKLRKPDGTVLTKTATFTTDGTDFKIRYFTIATDLDQAGDWAIQGYVEMPSWSGHTTVDQFEVGKT